MKQIMPISDFEYWKRQAELDDAELRAIQNAIKTSAVLLASFRIDALSDFDFPVRDEMFKTGIRLCRDYLKIRCYRKVYEKYCRTKYCRTEIEADTVKRRWIKLVQSEATIKCAEAMFDTIFLAESSMYARKRRNAKRASVVLALKREKGKIEN